ncbi:MAG: A24 family peptidase [Planctomycetaceae bacterium]|nr:A24 family peptidase [Planctomycetaceae bacterium]
MTVLGASSVGLLSGWWLERLIDRERAGIRLPPTSPTVRRWRPMAVMLATLGVCLWLQFCEFSLRLLDTPEVQPTEFGRQARFVYHGLLATLLLLATVIDLDSYLLPDQITVTGFLVGFGGAVAFQDLQIAHLWVDWAYAVPQLRGPLIPAWYNDYRWLHAVAWSLAGALVGGTVTQTVRVLSRKILGREAMGLGDVTFMVMIGSFLGWQAVVLIFALAPLTGVAFAVAGKLLANRPYLPYGPCLALATLIVLSAWSWFWEHTRPIFSDLTGVAILAAVAAAALVILLLAIRGYRSIPTRPH